MVEVSGCFCVWDERVTYEPEEREGTERTADAGEGHASVFFVLGPGGVSRFGSFEVALPP